MPGEKRFGTSFMGGFRKADVNEYIEKILREFDDKLKEKDDEIAQLRSQGKDLKMRYDELLSNARQVAEDRAKISEVLIKAQEQAEAIMENARNEAIEEKRQLENSIEKDREKLVDIRQDIKALKSEIVSTLSKYESQLVAIAGEDEEPDEIPSEASDEAASAESNEAYDEQM
jgi:cell division initiation protein